MTIPERILQGPLFSGNLIVSAVSVSRGASTGLDFKLAATLRVTSLRLSIAPLMILSKTELLSYFFAERNECAELRKTHAPILCCSVHSSTGLGIVFSSRCSSSSNQQLTRGTYLVAGSGSHPKMFMDSRSSNGDGTKDSEMSKPDVDDGLPVS